MASQAEWLSNSAAATAGGALTGRNITAIMVWSLVVEDSFEEVASDVHSRLIRILVVIFPFIGGAHADAAKHGRRVHFCRKVPCFQP